MVELASRVPRIVHVYKGPIPFTLYIGRAFAEFPESKWHNPIHLRCETTEERIRVLNEYEFEYMPTRPDLIADLHELDSQVLGCWCWPKMCHGWVLAKLFRRHILKEPV